MTQIAAWIDRVLTAKGESAVCAAVRGEVRAFCDKFPLPRATM